ncbi:MAG: FtsW/RodA/SpoVE family cell cycle protein, partial [Phycisphaeraceae bacterium]|nr:FtsW/RodA/SpoVE family cell cycle protein [Phycisphaeraceae bacterium]
MKSFLKVLSALLTPNFSWLTLLSAVALTIIGINVISGTTEPQAAAAQTKWLVIALGVMVFTWIPHPKTIGYLSFGMFVFTLVLLLILLIPGMPNSIVPVRNSARSWLNLGFMNMQPSELAKISFVLSLAWYLRNRDNYRKLTGLLPPFFIMFIPVILILKEPDLGSAMMFVPALFFMLIAAGARLKHLFALVGIGLAGLSLNIIMIYTLPNDMQILKKYQRNRITEFVDRQGDQQNKAMRILGSGGLSGYGDERSKLILRYNYLPENHNDMVFAVVVNRWGLLGGLTVVGLYTIFTGSMLIV